MPTSCLLPPGSPPLPEPQTFLASDGYALAYRLWKPAATPRATVVALHGIQSHSGWYGYSSERIAQAGYAVAFLDRRGSGVNEAARGDAPHAQRLIADVIQFSAHLSRHGPPKPRVLLGVSWGGKLAAATAALRPELFQGLALLYPGLVSRLGPNAVQRAAVRLAARAGAGGRSVQIPLADPALFTAERNFQNFITADPLALRRVTLRFVAAGLELDQILQSHAASLCCPALLMLAGRDAIVDNRGIKQLWKRFVSGDHTLHEYPAARHTLEFEPQRAEIFDDFIEWLGRTVA